MKDQNNTMTFEAQNASQAVPLLRKQIRELGEISKGCIDKTEIVHEYIGTFVQGMSFFSEFSNIQNCIDAKLYEILTDLPVENTFRSGRSKHKLISKIPLDEKDLSTFRTDQERLVQKFEKQVSNHDMDNGGNLTPIKSYRFSPNKKSQVQQKSNDLQK